MSTTNVVKKLDKFGIPVGTTLYFKKNKSVTAVYIGDNYLSAGFANPDNKNQDKWRISHYTRKVLNGKNAATDIFGKWLLQDSTGNLVTMNEYWNKNCKNVPRNRKCRKSVKNTVSASTVTSMISGQSPTSQHNSEKLDELLIVQIATLLNIDIGTFDKNKLRKEILDVIRVLVDVVKEKA